MALLAGDVQMRWFQPSAHGPPVLFVHIMKTGGTTVVRNLRETYPLDQIYPSGALDLQHDAGGDLDLAHHLSIPYVLGLPPERRRSIRVYIGHFPYVLRELLGIEMRAATVLRDPVERTVSLLHQLKRAQPWEADSGRRPVADRSLEGLYEDPAVFGPLILDHQTKVLSMTPADNPRTYTDVIDVDGSRLARAKASLAEMDVVGTTESFPAFLADTEAHFGWKVVRGARKNATPQEDREVVTAAFRRRIAKDNAIDVELHRHAQELVELRRGLRAP